MGAVGRWCEVEEEMNKNKFGLDTGYACCLPPSREDLDKSAENIATEADSSERPRQSR